MDFRIRDKVKVKATGSVGEVERVSEKLGILVAFPSGQSWSFRPDELEKVTPLASMAAAMRGSAP